MSYMLVNLSLLLVSVSGTPNFRPRFKYFHWSMALVGLVANFVIMWVLSWLYALIACIIFIIIVVLLAIYNSYRDNKSELEWGDVRMAILYHQIRKFLLRLNPREDHGKLWRPSLLLLAESLDSPLVRAGNSLKRGGVYICGSVLVAENLDSVARDGLRDLELAWSDRVADKDIKAFSQVVVAPTARFGCHNLMTSAGLGALSCNTVMLPMFGHETTAFESVTEYLQVLRDAASLEKNIVVACNFGPDDAELFEPAGRKAPETFMDLFILPHETIGTWDDFSQGPLGALTMGWALSRKDFSMRVINTVQMTPATDLNLKRDLLVDIIKRQGRFRIGKKGSYIYVVPTDVSELPDLDSSSYFELCNELVQRHRIDHTTLVFLPLPSINAEPQEWLTHASQLVQNLGPCLLYFTSPAQQMMSRKL